MNHGTVLEGRDEGLEPDFASQGALRAIELVLTRVIGTKRMGQERVLSGLAAGLSRARAIGDVADAIAEVPGVAVFVESLTPAQFERRAAGGAAVLAPAAEGWSCLCGGGQGGSRAYTVTRAAEQKMSARKLVRRLGFEARPCIVVEAQLALEALSHRSIKSQRPWLRLRALARLEGRDIAALFAFAVALGAMSLAVPVAVQVLVNTIALGSLFQPLVILALILFAALSFGALLQVIAWYAVEVLQRRVFVRVAEDFARRLINLEAEAHDEYDTPELVNRFFETVNVQKAMSRLLLDGLALVLQGGVGMALLAFYHPVLLAFDVAMIVALVGVGLLGFGAVRTAVDESHAKYRVAQWLETIAAQPLLFAGPVAMTAASVRADALTREYLSARRTHYRRVLRQLAGGVGVQVVAMVALLGIGGWLVMEGELTLGQLVAAELVVGVLARSFSKLGKHLETAYDLLASLDKIGKVVDLPVRSNSEGPTSVAPLSLSLDGVSAGIGQGPRSPELSIDLHGGARLCLTGTDTTAKSALLEVLAGHREPVAGTVTLASNPTGTGAALRRRSMLVRGVQVVPGTVLENLRLGDASLGEAQAWAVLEELRLERAVAALPEGLHTPLLSSGLPLSLSEVTRLSLARACAANPDLLLIDGALDQLDLPSEDNAALLAGLLGPNPERIAVVVTRDPQVQQHLEQHVNLDEIAGSQA